MMRFVFFPALVVAVATSSVPSGRVPHIFFVIVDDLGWGDVSYHHLDKNADIQTPTIDALVREGVDLNRHYAHMVCSPTRASFQSGRLPVHILTGLSDPCDGSGAIPRNMTGIAQVMKRAGYATHQVGKWDAGMATPKHTPHGRGYDTSLTYFSHGNWMYSEAAWLGSYDHLAEVPEATFKDLWDTDRPANNLNGTGYEELLFRDRMLKILREHDQSKPLFLQYDSRIAHYPLQAPPEYQERFQHIIFENRRMYAAMVAFLDDQLLNITSTMRELGMWENTLMVLSSDNGGYVKSPLGSCNSTGAQWPGASEATDTGHGIECHNGETGGNNFPLRGGKYDSFEGGIRVVSFMSGGFVPPQMRGQRSESMMHIADWYSTLAQGIAGLDPTDHDAATSGLPPIDSLNMWPVLSGEAKVSSRDSVGILVDQHTLLLGKWKYISGGTVMGGASWGSAEYPTETVVDDAIDDHQFQCPPAGCLFDVEADPGEHNELSAGNPEQVKVMLAELSRQAETIWERPHQEVNDLPAGMSTHTACMVAAHKLYNGFLGPFREVVLPDRNPGAPGGPGNHINSGDHGKPRSLRTIHKSAQFL